MQRISSEIRYTLPCGSFSTLMEMLVIDVSSILEFLLTVVLVPVVDDKVDDETEDINAGSEGDVATSIFLNPTKNLRLDLLPFYNKVSFY